MAGSALAANVHFVPNKVNAAMWVDQGTTLTESATIGGLGNADVVINMSATANASAVCINPGKGANQPPGQNPAPVTVSGTQTIPKGDITNGSTSFVVTTKAPDNPAPGSPGFSCPNENWREVITDLSFTSAHTTVEQLGVTELDVSCVFNPATANGVVPSQTVSCR